MARTAWDNAVRAFDPVERRWASPMGLAAELDPTTVRTAALDLIDAALVEMADGHGDRLMVLMAPQEGKSSLVSKRLPTWLLADVDPDARVAIVSYEVEIARRWGADIKLDARSFDGSQDTLDLGLRLRADSAAAGRWQIEGRRGGLYCVGIGGPLTGRPVDWLLVDDPLKDMEQAQSSAYRDRARRWWQSVAIPRLGPGSRAVLVQTRWHCLLPDSHILTGVGLARVDAIRSGDPVLTSAGVQAVEATGSRPHTGDIVSISTYGHPRPIKATPEHRILTDEGWREAGQLRALDWLVFPIPQGESSPDELRAMVPAPKVSSAESISRLTGVRLPLSREDMRQHLSDGLSYEEIARLYGRTTRSTAFGWARHYGLTRPSHHVMTGDPTADPDFWRVIGYWLAEGDVTAGRAGAENNVVRWTFGHSETDLAKDVTDVLGRYGLTVNSRPTRAGRSISVRCSSSQLAGLVGTAGHGAHHKRLPEILVHLPAPLARELVRGYWLGDGTATLVGGSMNDGWARITSVSLDLLMGFYRLLPRLGITPSVMKGGSPDLPKYELRFPLCQAPWLFDSARTVAQHSVRIDGDRLLVKVKALTVEQYDGLVYDLKTPAHDFVAANFVVHNSDDLAGWLLASEPDRWRVISIPAVAESHDDPLGRLPGEAMASARGERDWKGIREQVGEYVWAALYQQRPAPAEGGLFRREAWRYWTPAGGYAGTLMDLSGKHADWRDCWRFLTVDLAASTKTSADWTVASAWALTGDRDLVLLDRVRVHAAPGEHWTLVRGLCDRWRIVDVGVESSMASTTLVRDATNAGIGVFALTPETDKLTRALPAAARVDAGKVYLPAGAPWLATWLDEAVAFPNATHDDQVDTLSYAVNVAAGRWSPGGDPVPDHRPTERDPLTDWDGRGAVDLASAPF